MKNETVVALVLGVAMLIVGFIDLQVSLAQLVAGN